MSRRRVVVTGLGLVTPVGNTVKESWDSILAGKSGVAPIEHFDVSGFNTRFGGSVKDFDISPYLNPKDARKMDLFIQYGIAAGAQAIEDAGIECTEENADRIGVAIGSGIGGLPMIEHNHNALNKSGARRISPFFVPGSIINMISGNLAIQHGFRGPNIAITTACTTGTHNIGYSARTIAYGDADVMVCGGAEMATTPLGLGGFSAARALSTRNDDPQAASRPWDKDRDGFVLSDGAGVVVLEEYEHAKARGATIYAELIGFGMSDDAYHMTLPPEDGRGAAASMANAIKDAGIDASEIDYINAHGTSTAAGDLAESRAVEKVMGSAAESVAVSSTKSMIGHLLGAAGAVEAVFSILAIRDQALPPTINLDNPQEGCVLDYVPHTARDAKVDVTLSNSFGFGGTNGTLVFKKA
ncbi:MULTISPECIES: beta-ketoacyl-ACP synthase II [unclassified Halomonas]|uniref:beta-ketoacyl-ACP synthase II n=1 Tax=unclassified Halomonas TaxID=2609666 RepID=UPI000C93DFD2|nr:MULTISPECIES: beta-ketoacyl-ACP synthase II [unclassified Halomonas]MBR9878821.1 beta-ketoacyl-ACP synthase II [Gammaproteobacteria bacterium]MAR70804.1 beta-ketoacyl-[acyl-carrier-protein] synthase II [Halomonas sp.]MBY5941999.1 beta-ketoacyl-ACP synthase II [Halomonas sp. DP5N14-9]MBY6112218.1 beta-ketoacyl-ACP synthase II [Halomonas sp. DP1Y21-3]MCJ8286759.1 beta-ketoacyl-ACP synthase II [Halomonas sp.]